MDNPALLECVRALAELVAPPPTRTCAEFADAERILPPSGPRGGGPWRTDLVPYTRAVMDSAVDPETRETVFVAPTQSGKTESLINILLRSLADGPQVPILWVAPDRELATSMSKDRVSDAIRRCRALAADAPRGHRDGITEKFLRGTVLRFGWAGSATRTSSHPCGLVIVDERDRMRTLPRDGDPYVTAKARTRAYRPGHVVCASSPTVDDGPIMLLWESGTRMRWEWQCPECRDWHAPRARYMGWPKGCDPDTAAAEGWYACPHCGVQLDVDRLKPELNAGGRYRTYRRAAGDADYVPDPEPVKSRLIQTFWVSGVCAPGVPAAELRYALRGAYASHDQATIQGVLNTDFGEPYQLRGDAPEWMEVQARALPYLERTVPAGVLRVAMGCDVQHNGIWYVIRGFGFNLTSWLLARGFVHGDTAYDDVYLALAKIISAPIGDRQVDICFIDSGYKPIGQWRRPENLIYSFARRTPRVWATKGQARQARPLIVSTIDRDGRGRALPAGLQLVLVHASWFKAWVYARVRWPMEADSGGWWTFSPIDEDYCRQVVAEEVVALPSGEQAWVASRHRPNHILDCEALASAAAHFGHWEALEDTPEASEATPAPAVQLPAAARFTRRGL